MAQRRRWRSSGYNLSRRMGLAGSSRIVIGCALIACLAGGASAYRQFAETGAVIERTAPAATPAKGNGRNDTTVEDTPTETDEQTPEVVHYVVHVDGAVSRPGVVELMGQDLRVHDAVEEAGGLLDDADTSSINLAEPLSDGAKIHIPHAGEEAITEPSAGTQAGQTQTSGATEPGAGTALVNINTADTAALETLPGVGPATAAAILDDRTKNGPFETVEDLMRVSGIGEKRFARLKDLICV